MNVQTYYLFDRIKVLDWYIKRTNPQGLAAMAGVFSTIREIKYSLDHPLFINLAKTREELRKCSK
jgi:hypothetical protein